MPSALEAQNKATSHDDLDNYDVGDLSDDPFKSPKASPSNKRKADESGLGIDEEVDVQKRARAPRVKLDEDRLLGEKGIPTLKKRAAKLKFKGKGHEFSDAGRLLEFFQLWLDDLFPKARFLDALAMVEKAGHKKRVVAARDEWLHENRPKSTDDLDDDFLPTDSNGRAQTPNPHDIPADDDLFGATPRARPPVTGGLIHLNNDAPEEDDLDALMAEAEASDRPAPAAAPAAPVTNEEDDLDALIAEAEDADSGNKNSGPSNNNAQQTSANFDDEEDAMREMDGMW